MSEWLSRPWPWYVAGPLIGLFPPLLLIVGNKLFGMSSNFRHLCAAIYPRSIKHLSYDWRGEGAWNLVFALGIMSGGFLAGWVLRNPEPVAIAMATRDALAQLGVDVDGGLAPAALFGADALLNGRALLFLVIGGFLAGFGTSYAGGCTSGHGLSGIADLQPASFIALVSFFVGGIIGTFLVLPLLLS